MLTGLEASSLSSSGTGLRDELYPSGAIGLREGGTVLKVGTRSKVFDGSAGELLEHLGRRVSMISPVLDRTSSKFPETVWRL